MRRVVIACGLLVLLVLVAGIWQAVRFPGIASGLVLVLGLTAAAAWWLAHRAIVTLALYRRTATFGAPFRLSIGQLRGAALLGALAAAGLGFGLMTWWDPLETGDAASWLGRSARWGLPCIVALAVAELGVVGGIAAIRSRIGAHFPAEGVGR